MIRGAGGVVGAQMVIAATGAAFTGTVTAYVTGDGGTQAITTTNSGICVHEGNGYHTQTLTAAESDFDLIAVTFIGTGAIPVTIQIETDTVPTLTPTAGSPATGATTALNLINDAFCELGVFIQGEDIPAADGNAGLRALNGMLGSWAQQNLTIPTTLRSVQSFVVGKGGTSNPYTIGPSGDFDLPRPANGQSLKRAANLLAGTVVEAPIGLLTDAAWQAWPTKDLTGPYVSMLFYQPTFTSGLGAIYLWPVPTAATNSLVLYLEAPLATFADLTTSYSLPPAYQEAMVWNLARRLAKPYGHALDEDLMDKARSSLAVIKRSNLSLDSMGNYFTGRSWYDLVSGQTYVR